MSCIRFTSSYIKVIGFLVALIANVGFCHCQVAKPTVRKPITTVKPIQKPQIQTTKNSNCYSGSRKASANVVRISEEAYASKGIKSAKNVNGKTVTQICSETSTESRANLSGTASKLSSSKKIAAVREYDSNGYHYTTDEQGRIVKVEGKIEIPENKKPRSSLPELDDMKDTDDKGHLIAHEFGGADDKGNLVPMDSDLNRYGEYRNFEREIEQLIKEGKEVNVRIECEYDGTSSRPTSFTVSYEVDGEITERTFING